MGGSNTKGKKFEQKFKADWEKSFPEGICVRLNDQMSHYKFNSQNISDFICYTNGLLFLIELKTRAGSSINFNSIPQYTRLLPYSQKKGCVCGVLIWFYEHTDVGVVFLPVSTITKMLEDGLKSFSIKHLSQSLYPSIVLPTIKKNRVYLDTDYFPLISFATISQTHN